MTDNDRKILAKAYVNAGRGYVASRLAKIFALIDGNDKVAVHNFVTDELSKAVGVLDNDPEASGRLFLDLADVILNHIQKGLQ